MANHLGTTLSRLIRERSYKGGELRALEHKEAAAKSRAMEAQAEYRKLLSQRRQTAKHLAKLDAEIQKRSAIDPAEIRAVRAMPRKMKCRHGSVNAELVRFLREAGHPIGTTDIIAHMAAKYGKRLDTPQAREEARRWVTEKLRVLVRKNAVHRLHDTDSTVPGLWLWVGRYAGAEEETEA